MLQNTKNITSPWTHWFLVGDTGTGKTTLASSFPRPLFIVPRNEGSMTALMGRNFLFKEVSTRKEMDDLLSEIEKEYKHDPNGFPFDTIVVESISHYADLVIEELTLNNRFNMDQQRWGVLSSHFRTIHSRLRALDLHTVFTSLVKIDRNKEGAIVNGGPLLQGNMSYKLPSACDIFALCEVREGKVPIYETWFTARNGVPARSRFPGTPSSIRNCTYGAMKPFLQATPEVEASGTLPAASA